MDPLNRFLNIKYPITICSYNIVHQISRTYSSRMTEILYTQSEIPHIYLPQASDNHHPILWFYISLFYIPHMSGIMW